MNNIAEIGHNKPPSDLEILKAALPEKYPEIVLEVKTISEYQIPESVEDDIKSGELTDFVKRVKEAVKDIEAAHKETKAPYWECGKYVDKWKSDYEITLSSIIKKAEKPILDFLNKKAEAERARQLEIAQAEQAKATALLEEAKAHEDAGLNDVADELMNAAVKAETYAEKIESGDFQQNAKTRSFGGVTSSSSKVWVATIESLQAIDLEALRPYFKEDEIQRALNAAVKNGVRELRGAKITEQSKLNIR